MENFRSLFQVRQLPAFLLSSETLIWVIAAVATAAAILRLFSLPDAVWPLAGAAVMVLAGLLPLKAAATGIGKGLDVYLFLGGMMLLGTLARREGLFDWLAAKAAHFSKGSPQRLFVLLYAIGICVTIFLSNDATAVILTPAVAAVVKAVRAKDPLPYLFICAFTANAASFALPVSNPANLVIYGSHMPSLSQWLAHYGLASLVSIIATFGIFYLTQRKALEGDIEQGIETPPLPVSGRLAALGIALSALLLLAASAFGRDLGPPTCFAGLITTSITLALKRESPWPVLRDISWGILPFVAGLFVLVEALQETSLIASLAKAVNSAEAEFGAGAVFICGLATALAGNLMNNLPAGLLAASIVEAAKATEHVRAAILIGIDLGPNISLTGSLATLLWLAALRREDIEVGALKFLRLGLIVTLPTLCLSLATLLLSRS